MPLDRSRAIIVSLSCRPGQDQPVVSYDETHIYEASTGNEKESDPEDKNLVLETCIANPDPSRKCILSLFSVYRLIDTASNTVLGHTPHAHEPRIRVPSHYLRELTRGKFVINYVDITLLDSIGEGTTCINFNDCMITVFCRRRVWNSVQGQTEFPWKALQRSGCQNSERLATTCTHFY